MPDVRGASTDHELLIHVGGPKCASSAIQSAMLVHHGQIVAAGVHPAVLDATPSLQVGPEARSTAWRHLAGGMRLHQDLGGLIRSGRLTPPNLRDMLARAVDRHGRVVISDEGLANLPLARRLIDAGLCAGIPARVLLYVRPQVDVLNSAWWQWGAWGGQVESVDDWLDQAIDWHWLRWDVVALRWGEAVGADRVTTRLLPAAGDDVSRDFLRWLGVGVTPDPDVGHVNRSLPKAVLDHYLRQPHLRPGPHSADIDFVVDRASRGLPDSVTRAPIVLDVPQRQRVLDRFEPNNRSLLRHWIADEHRDRMLRDPRWWPEPTATDPDVGNVWDGPDPATAADLDLLVSLLWSTVLEQERRIRRLEAGG
jgi:hypothetical protein